MFNLLDNLYLYPESPDRPTPHIKKDPAWRVAEYKHRDELWREPMHVTDIELTIDHFYGTLDILKSLTMNEYGMPMVVGTFSLRTTLINSIENSYLNVTSYYVRNYSKINAVRTGFNTGFFPTPPSAPVNPWYYWLGGAASGYYVGTKIFGE